MNITVIGSGYVGLVTGVCFSEMGNLVTCVDIDENKIDKLNQGIVPIYEPGLSELILKNKEENRLFFTSDLKSALAESEVVFIAVGTPMGEDGSADLKYVLQVAKDIGGLIDKRIVVVDKSTVPVGTAERVRNTIQAELDSRNIQIKFDVVSNPEFLKEGAAINDFMKPDRVVIGADNEYAFKVMTELYRPFFKTRDRFVTMDIRSAEMTKYAANAMLATKISFMNEMANICEKVGADVNKVRIGIGSDSRIGYSFIYPGCGYGGSCFPKDVNALIKIAEEKDYRPELLHSVEAVNSKQKEWLANKVIHYFGERNLSKLTLAVWGLSFKPETDDMREAPSIETIRILSEYGVKFKAYDPKAMTEAEHIYLKDYNNVTYCKDKYETLSGANAIILHTEWKEFRSPDFKRIKAELKDPVFFDGRNQFDSEFMNELGITYHCIGK
jgi:UDPglucose 6-dehydrogenase